MSVASALHQRCMPALHRRCIAALHPAPLKGAGSQVLQRDVRFARCVATQRCNATKKGEA
jgi:hypothetical protein